jgi:hypothetical protein
MQLPQLTLDDISLMLAVGAIIMLIILEFSSRSHGQTKFIVSEKKLNTVTFVTGVSFLVSIGLKIIYLVAAR